MMTTIAPISDAIICWVQSFKPEIGPLASIDSISQLEDGHVLFLIAKNVAGEDPKITNFNKFKLLEFINKLYKEKFAQMKGPFENNFVVIEVVQSIIHIIECGLSNEKYLKRVREQRNIQILLKNRF